MTILCRNVTVVCGASYHLLGSRISQDSKIRFRLQVESCICDWLFSESRLLASYVSRHKAMAYDKCRTPRCHIKFKKGNNHRRSRRLQHRKMNSFLFMCGWSSYAETMLHVHSLLQCLHQPPVSQDLESMAKQAQWDYLVEKFITNHHCPWSGLKILYSR